MTLDEDLVETVDKVVRDLRTTRSAFAREALKQAIDRVKNQQLEAKHRQGHLRKPIDKDEFAGWEKEQVWGDE
jgi:metal-responsive CopG/Arc/MetJ family transcriptional regulator